MISGGLPAMKSQIAPDGAFNVAGLALRTTTGFAPYGQVSNVSTVSNVLRPITIASTVAMNSS